MMRSDMTKQMQGPNAPAGRGYNRPGFAGRGPLAARPEVTTMPVVQRQGFKKGGTVTPKGNGCCAKNKPCKMS